MILVDMIPYKSQEDDSENIHIIKFSGSRLPPDDGNFYQLCYVTYSGVVKGASHPFQFSNSVHLYRNASMCSVYLLPCGKPHVIYRSY